MVGDNTIVPESQSDPARERSPLLPVRHQPDFFVCDVFDAALKVLAAQGAVKLAFCWSHVRRPFYELAQSGPAPIASDRSLTVMPRMAIADGSALIRTAVFVP